MYNNTPCSYNFKNMTYIQNKLKEFHHKFCEFTDGGVLVHYCKDGNCLDEFITQILTDYHNHIVEKIHKLKRTDDTQMSEDRIYDEALEDILSLLQDTNPNEL